jgi:hypothetical protein
MDPLNLHRKKGMDPAELMAESARAEATNVAERLVRLEAAVSRLVEISRALWEIVRDSIEAPEEALRERLDVIRAREAEARKQPQPAPPCPKCNRPLERGRTVCVYCGTPHQEFDLFDLIF